MTDSPDLTNLERFLVHLHERDAAAAAFARTLLAEGATVRDFWGPEQMDVWELRVQRGDVIVRFGVERGFSDGVLLGPADAANGRPTLRPLRIAIFAWAVANDVPLRVEDPDDFAVDLTEHGIAAVDWMGEGHEPAVARVQRAWSDYRSDLDRQRRRAHGRPAESRVRAVKAAGVSAMRAAAAAS